MLNGLDLSSAQGGDEEILPHSKTLMATGRKTIASDVSLDVGVDILRLVIAVKKGLKKRVRSYE
ncbi:hypothetical protein, partial [Yoonia sp.]|uniref:hypothetical protein n=1 Tax=Yoonia sp. TaxID=2212373 RepID=UPI003A4E1EC3